MIWIAIPGLPPTSNHAYSQFMGRKVLTKVGRQYLKETQTVITMSFREELLLMKKNVPLATAFRFTYTELTNKGYPNKAESRYKRLDVSNRLKLCEDAWVAAAGIDDSQHMVVALKKQQGPEELTEIWAWDLEQEVSPFDDAFNRL